MSECKDASAERTDHNCQIAMDAVFGNPDGLVEEMEALSAMMKKAAEKSGDEGRCDSALVACGVADLAEIVAFMGSAIAMRKHQSDQEA